MANEAAAKSPSEAARAPLGRDVVAGLTTALVLVPQAMGYALLAGLPPVVGLHASSFGLVAYAALGTSAALAIGPVAMDSLLTADALRATGLATPEALVAAAGLLALFVGLLQLLMGALRLGQISNLLSTPVVTGFTAAAALLILGTQVPTMLGLPSTTSSSVIDLARHLVAHASAIAPREVAVAAGSFAALLVFERVRPTWPRGPIVLAAATVTTLVVPALQVVRRVGDVPSALPSPHLELPTLELVRTLAPHALTLAVVAFVEAFSVARKFAATHGDPVADRELRALGAANVATALSGGYPITGGLSRSAVLVRAGAVTRRAGLVTAAAVTVAGLTLSPVLATIPRAALAALVASSVLNLVDVAEAKRLTHVKPRDGAFIAVAFLATLGLGFQWGIGIGVAVQVADFVWESTRPHVALLGRIPGTTTYRNLARYPEATPIPGLLLVRIDAQLYFGNATFLRDTLLSLVETHRPHTVIVDASGVNQIDSSAEGALARVVDAFDRRSVRLVLASVKGPVRDVMKRSGLWARLGRDRLFLDVHSAVETLVEPPPTSGGPRALSPAI